jgi:hypothetical protein
VGEKINPEPTGLETRPANSSEPSLLPPRCEFARVLVRLDHVACFIDNRSHVSPRSDRTIFIADAHRDDRKRFVVRAGES